MFDIGFPELVLISIVALLVLGPDKLPQAIRTISLWTGRLQRSFAKLRREIESEIGADEIRQQLRNESVMADLEQARDTVQEMASEVNKTIHSVGDELQTAEQKARQGAAGKEPKADSSAEDQVQTAGQEAQQGSASSEAEADHNAEDQLQTDKESRA